MPPQQIPTSEFAEFAAEVAAIVALMGKRSGTSAVERLTIVGTGLIGASVGLAAKAAGVLRCRGSTPTPSALGVAAEKGAVDEAAFLAGGRSPSAELAVVAAPVTQLARAGRRRCSQLRGEQCTVTDVGSTKSAVCAGAQASRRGSSAAIRCAGPRRAGRKHASGELFQGATWFLTPLAGTNAERYRLVHGFVTDLGATPVAIDPETHDRLVALTSHLPHALANLLVNQAGSTRVERHDPLLSAGGSLRDMTRVAGANPRIWVDIFLENAAADRGDSLA